MHPDPAPGSGPVRLPVEPVRPGDPVSAQDAAAQPTSMVLRGGIPLGKPFGIPVRLSLASLGLYFFVAFATLGNTVFHSGHTIATSYLVSLIGAVLLELSIFAHEIGHCIIARKLGLRVVGLRLWIFGGLTEVETEKFSPRREYAVAVIGPMVSITLGGLCGGLGLLLHAGDDSITGLTLFWLGVINALLAAYNLLPGLPFDGGRVLRAAVWAGTGRALTGTRVAAVAGYVAAGLTALLVLSTAGSDSAGIGISLIPGLAVAGYIALQARNALRTATLSERAPFVSAGRLTRRAILASADLPLAEAMRRAGVVGATSVIVTSSDGRPQSLLSGTQADQVPLDRRPWVPVSSVSRPITTGLILDARLAGEAVLEALRRHPAGEYLVVEPTGHIRGVLATIDVAAFLDPGMRVRAS